MVIKRVVSKGSILTQGGEPLALSYFSLFIISLAKLVLASDSQNRGSNALPSEVRWWMKKG